MRGALMSASEDGECVLQKSSAGSGSWRRRFSSDLSESSTSTDEDLYSTMLEALEKQQIPTDMDMLNNFFQKILLPEMAMPDNTIDKMLALPPASKWQMMLGQMERLKTGAKSLQWDSDDDLVLQRLRSSNLPSVEDIRTLKSLLQTGSRGCVTVAYCAIAPRTSPSSFHSSSVTSHHEPMSDI